MKTLNQQFCDTVEHYGSNIAIHHLGTDYRYEQLHARILALASWLRDHKLLPGDRVALLLPNSVDYYVSYFAIQLAGGIVVALNPESTPRELSGIFANCEPTVAIYGAKAKGIRAILAEQPDMIRIAIEADVEESKETNRSVPSESLSQAYTTSSGTLVDENEIALDDIAQIIYTSGTSGKPKGVTLSHRNLAANSQSIVEYLALTQRDSVFVVLPFFYSYGNSLLLTHMAVGGRLVLADQFTFWNRALDIMQSQQSTGFSGVPSSLAMLVHKSDFCRRDLPDLRYITCAGGAVTPIVAQKIREAFPNVEFFNMYGQTEASARLSALMPVDFDARPRSIGRGIPGVELSLVDEHGQQPALGEVGEIVARGENIMQGYWNDPEGTAQVIREDGLYTGDLARADEGGFLYVVGRSTEMIKSGAYRISPLEIEGVIAEVPGIAEVAVIGEPDEVFGERPVAYVVLKHGAEPPTEAAVLKHCAQLLPRYKLIHKLYFEESLPKTASGKIRKAELRWRAGVSTDDARPAAAFSSHDNETSPDRN